MYFEFFFNAFAPLYQHLKPLISQPAALLQPLQSRWKERTFRRAQKGVGWGGDGFEQSGDDEDSKCNKCGNISGGMVTMKV